jgi:hypothetical protein
MKIVDIVEGKYSGPMEPLTANGKPKPGAVKALKQELLKAKKSGTDLGYKTIDAMMQKICRAHNITGQKLHDDFVKATNLIPDNWIKKIEENFADGKKPGRKGLAKRSGVNCKQSVSKLRSIAAHSTGEKQRMAHWCANMKAGKKK